MLTFATAPLPNNEVKKKAASQVLSVYGILNTGNKTFNDHIQANGVRIITPIASTMSNATSSSFIRIYYRQFLKVQRITPIILVNILTN